MEEYSQIERLIAYCSSKTIDNLRNTCTANGCCIYCGHFTIPVQILVFNVTGTQVTHITEFLCGNPFLKHTVFIEIIFRKEPFGYQAKQLPYRLTGLRTVCTQDGGRFVYFHNLIVCVGIVCHSGNGPIAIELVVDIQRHIKSLIIDLAVIGPNGAVESGRTRYVGTLHKDILTLLLKHIHNNIHAIVP